MRSQILARRRFTPHVCSAVARRVDDRGEVRTPARHRQHRVRSVLCAGNGRELTGRLPEPVPLASCCGAASPVLDGDLVAMGGTHARFLFRGAHDRSQALPVPPSTCRNTRWPTNWTLGQSCRADSRQCIAGCGDRREGADSQDRTRGGFAECLYLNAGSLARRTRDDATMTHLPSSQRRSGLQRRDRTSGVAPEDDDPDDRGFVPRAMRR
jgi:hypothetical protein